jgi:replication factor C large subunit
MIPWIKKYTPKRKEDIVGQDSQMAQLEAFITGFKQSKRKAMVVHGPCGVGKTSSVYALASGKNLEVVELNASDFRNKDAIERVLGSATKQRSLFFSSKIILVDDVDGLSGRKDRGGVAALVNVIKNTAFPIVITAIDPYDKKLSSLRKVAQLVQFNTLEYGAIYVKLQAICDLEGIQYEESALKSLSRQAGGDLRAAINDLQTLTMETKSITSKDLDALAQRRQIETMPSALVKVFKVKDPFVALSAFNDVQEDIGQQFLWIDENLPKEYSGKDLARAYDVISKADVFYGRIRRWQYWRFLVYVNALLTAGVALSKQDRKKEFVQYVRTQRLLTLWKAKMKYQKRNAIAEKLASVMHTSKRQVVKDVLPYMQEIFRKHSPMAKGIAAEAELDPDEVSWLSR